MKNEWRKKTVLWRRPSPDKHPTLPFSTNLIKINHLLPSLHFTKQSNPIPNLDYSSAWSYVRHIRHHLLVPEEIDLGISWLLLQYFQRAATMSQLWLWPGCYLRSSWEKSLRTNPTLNFQQRRENTSTVIQFNVVLFGFSPSHISLKSLRNNVTHTYTHTDWFIDYTMSPAVMFHSHVYSLIVLLAYLWPDWNLMKFFNEQSLCDSLWRAKLNSHTPVCVCVCNCQCVCLSMLQEFKFSSERSAWTWLQSLSCYRRLEGILGSARRT